MVIITTFYHLFYMTLVMQSGVKYSENRVKSCKLGIDKQKTLILSRFFGVMVGVAL